MQPKQQILLERLNLVPEGIKEYELMTLLDIEYGFFDDLHNELGIDCSLFKRHFYLFHHLYSLSDVIESKGASLEINALCIKLTNKVLLDSRAIEKVPNNKIQEYHSSTGNPSAAVKEFYLDKNNLNLPDEDVQAMLDDFWTQYFALDKKTAAIECLGLQDYKELNLYQIKKRYNQLAAQHHPDKGGDELKFVEVKEAYEQLKDSF